MTSSNQLRIAFIEETTFGSTPASPTMLTINSTGHGLGNQNKFDQDPTIRSDRNVTDLVRMDRTAGGSINYALRYSPSAGAESTLMRYALQSGTEVAVSGLKTGSTATAFPPITLTSITAGPPSYFTAGAAHGLAVNDVVRFTTGGTLPTGLSLLTDYYITTVLSVSQAQFSASLGGSPVVLVASTGSGTHSITQQINKVTLDNVTDLSAGDIVRVRTSSDALLGYFPIVSIVSLVITIEGTLAAGQSGLKVIRGAKMKNGTTQKSMSVEIGYTNTGLYEVFPGCVVDGMDFSVATEQMITGSYTIIGKAGSGVSMSAISSAIYTAASTSPVMEAVDHIPNFRVGSVNYAARSISVNIANGGEAQKAIGTLGVTAVRSGTFTIKGQIACYFSSIVEYNKMIAATTSSFLMVTQDTAGNAYTWYMPTVKYGGVSVPVSGQDTDVIMTLDYQAIYNSTIAATILVQRFEN